VEDYSLPETIAVRVRNDQSAGFAPPTRNTLLFPQTRSIPPFMILLIITSAQLFGLRLVLLRHDDITKIFLKDNYSKDLIDPFICRMGRLFEQTPFEDNPGDQNF
jgi:hypothetical protein